MKKQPELIFVIVIVVVCIIAIGMVAMMNGNRQIVDMTRRFEYAMIKMPDGSVVEGQLDSWLDFEDGDQIQLKIDGETYLTHVMNTCLISK